MALVPGQIKTSRGVMGVQMTIGAGRKAFPVTIVFMHYARPMIGMGRNLTPIDNPERFGAWETLGQKRKYVQSFVADWDAHQDAWDAIPCSVCGKPGDPCECAS